MTFLRITNGRLIDPTQNLDRVADLWIQAGKIVNVGPQPALQATSTIDASGMIVCPGLIDMQVHLREPGREEDETIATGAASAIRGGITSIACMPSTDPPIDHQAAAEFVYLQAGRAGNANVYPIGCLTKGRKGTELAEIGGLVDGGAVAFTDDDAPVVSAEIMRRALEYCRMFDRAVLSHAEDLELTKGGVMHEGLESMRLGLRGMPAAAEEVMTNRDIELAHLTGGRIHFLHVSTAGSVELIRRAKHNGVRVTAATCPHYCLLTDKELRRFDSNYKLNPPLRTEADVHAIIEGLKDGTLDVLASDHSPHTPEKKLREFDQAPFGIVGLETLLPLSIKALVEPGHLSWSQLIEKLTMRPAKVLGIDRGRLQPGKAADITLIDPASEWTIDVANFASKSRNSPFDGVAVRGRVDTVIVGGAVKFERNR